MSAGLKPLETLSLSLQGCVLHKEALTPKKIHSKSTNPTKSKMQNELTLPVRVVPPRRAMSAACTSLGANKVMTLSTLTLVQAADMALGTGSVSLFYIFDLVGFVLFE